jgi:Holliday junction resolvase RusA-like endonuclease
MTPTPRFDPLGRQRQYGQSVAGWRVAYDVRVSGIPKGQPRARAFARPMGGGKFSARMYDPGSAEAWKGDIAHAFGAVSAPLPAGPIRVDITFLFPRPGKLNRKKDPDGRVYHTAKPDRDNAEKAVLDCLTRLGVWADDAQVCEGTVRKFYAAKGERPGAEIRVSVLATGGAS